VIRGLRPPPHLHGPAGAGLLAVALVAFGVLAADLLGGGPITQADIPISRWSHDHMSARLTQFLLLVTHLHSTTAICLMALALGLALAWARQWAWLSALILGVPGGLLLNAALKHGFQRVRPSFDTPVLTLASYGFPSGHTAGATVWWGFIATLCFAWQRRPWPRAAALGLAAAMICTTALSRVYLGVHYPSDVLAAVAEGIAWLALCFMLQGAWSRHG
jgi:membrane-associated phospholipid phosphatase